MAAARDRVREIGRAWPRIGGRAGEIDVAPSARSRSASGSGSASACRAASCHRAAR